jgi:hypothetical protein
MLGPFEVFCFPYVKSESSTVKRANRSRHIKRTDPRETFEAAHAFIIALIQAFTGTPDTTPSQIPFMKELIPFYARLLLAYDDWVCCAQLVCSDVLPSVLLDISPASFRKRKITHAKQKSSVEGD